jgi:hypothetical protein
MHPIFTLTASDIQRLNDEQARELVARLCKAELRCKGIGTDQVTWGGDQRAKDGGVDVRVGISTSAGITGYVPRDTTAYQVKAESFTPAKIPEEMAPKGVLRPAIEELSKNFGAYVIVSTKDSCSDSSLKSRKSAMSDCLEQRDLVGEVHLDFYDSRRIADWAGNYPGVLVWLRSVLGKPIQGWKSYSPWAYREKSIEDEFLLDDKIKVFVPNTDEAFSINDAIKRMRGELAKPRASTRIVGLSGVGKTRLVQALFDNRVEASSSVALNEDNVLYTDLSDNPTPQPTSMIEALIQEGADCVVVIDNCGQDSHRKLTEIAQRPESKIRLVTVEYDIRDDLPDGTACYRLEGSSGEVITKLLKRNYQTLSDLDIHKIVEFSDGNARVAFALASTSEANGQLAKLRDDELFKRLFIQKHTESDALQRCAEAACLLYSFDAEDDSKESELAILASIADVSITIFQRNIAELKRRGLVQQRGKWRAVLPHAIANRLALRSLDAYPPQTLIRMFVSEASERVARSFSRRLGYLHESKTAAAIANEWLRPDGLLGDATKLHEFGRQMLENIAPINQRAALDAVLRATESEEFLSVTNLNRSLFARLLRSLAYDSILFNDAASALLRFALREPEDCKSDSVHEALQSLFYSHLSGTLASPEQRLIFVKSLALSEAEAKQKLAIRLLEAGLETYHFSSSYGFDFGALKRTYGWYPKTLEDFRSWYGAFVQLAAQIGKNDTQVGRDARSLLGTAIRGLWGDECMNELLINVARELASVDGWPDGWIGIRNALHWNKEHLETKSLEQLRLLENELAPRDLRGKIQAKVLTPWPFSANLEDEEEAETLGKAAALDKAVLLDLCPYLFNTGQTNKPFFFGVGVGQEYSSVHALLDQARELIANALNVVFDLQFVLGLLEGWNKTKPEEVSAFLDSAIDDKAWAFHFPILQLSVKLDDAGYNRLIKSIELGQAPCWKYTQLGSGRRTDGLSVQQLSKLLDLLALKPDNGLAVAIGVLCMVVHCTDNKDADYRKELQVYVSNFVAELDWSELSIDNHNFLFHLEKLIEFALLGNDPCRITKQALTRLIKQEHAGKRIYSRHHGSLLRPFFKENPLDALDTVYSEDDKTMRLRLFPIQLDRHDETALSAVPPKALIDWCKDSPEDRCKYAAQGCKLYERENPDDSNNENVLSISTDARAILHIAPNKEEVLNILVGRFYPSVWSGSRAAILRQRASLLDQCNPTGDPELSELIKEANVRLSKDISEEEQWEQERERKDTGSFE